MVEMLSQITLPDGIGAAVTSLLAGMLALMQQRQRRIEALARSLSLIAARDAIRQTAMMDMLRIAVKNGMTADEREDTIVDIYMAALSALGKTGENAEP